MFSVLVHVAQLPVPDMDLSNAQASIALVIKLSRIGNLSYCSKDTNVATTLSSPFSFSTVIL